MGFDPGSCKVFWILDDHVCSVVSVLHQAVAVLNYTVDKSLCHLWNNLKLSLNGRRTVLRVPCVENPIWGQQSCENWTLQVPFLAFSSNHPKCDTAKEFLRNFWSNWLVKPWKLVDYGSPGYFRGLFFATFSKNLRARWAAASVDRFQEKTGFSRCGSFQFKQPVQPKFHIVSYSFII